MSVNEINSNNVSSTKVNANKPHLLLIDAMNLIRRIYAAVPGEGEEALEAALNSSGHAVGRLVSRFQPSHGVCAFDGGGLSWRHHEYPAYKAGRKPMPDSLKAGLPRFEQLFRFKGLSSVTYPELEADDVLTTLAAKTLAAGGRVTLVSTDKGFAQLLPGGSDRLFLWDHFAKLEVDEAFIRNRFRVAPAQLCDYLALCGDTTNHVRGVKGIGAKTAAALLERFADLEAIYANLDAMTPRQRTALENDREQAFLARRLVALQTGIDLSCRLSDFRLAPE